jgi:CBS domain-containing protein
MEVMQASDIMIDHAYTVNEKDSIREVLRLFIDKGISGVPVVDDEHRIVAFITDGDIMRFIGKHKDTIIDTFYFISVVRGDEDEYEDRTQAILNKNVMTIATKKVVKIQWDEAVENVAALLSKKQFKKVPVEKDGKLAGIISRGDIIRTSFKDLL